MQASSYYKQSRLAEPADNYALAWLAGRLRWERALERLRSKRSNDLRKAA